MRKSYAEAFERRLSSFKAAANEGGISGRTRRRRRARLIEALAACQSPTFQPDDEDTDPCSLTDDEEEATAAVEEKDDDEEEEEEKEKEEVVSSSQHYGMKFSKKNTGQNNHKSRRAIKNEVASKTLIHDGEVGFAILVDIWRKIYAISIFFLLFYFVLYLYNCWLLS